ncbi:hypothetical protein JKF63_06570 [Porcisia hertigi]|uniref:Uncharacterized protein n=1 Tax=Porcisia hertigi TaxID=2761500 RepID=A0A836LCY7_9TRYP|nr:hypothetical protein JKF63_06570 [Porcisia hertigi]
MSHATFLSGQLPGMPNGTGSALLPTITAELRGEFSPLLLTLASCNNDISDTYVMELFFTLVRFDAVLKERERQLLVSTAQHLISKQLHQLQKVHHMQKLLNENERFVGELVERCAALECLRRARDGDDECHTNDGEDTDDMNVSEQALQTSHLENDLADRQSGSKKTAPPSATAKAAGAGAGRRRAAPAATYASNSPTGDDGDQQPQRVFFDDSHGDISSRLLAAQHSQERQPHRAGASDNAQSTWTTTTGSGGATTPPSPQTLPSRQNVQPGRVDSEAGVPGAGRARSATATPPMQNTASNFEHVNSETLDEDGGRVTTASGSFARPAGSTAVKSALYSGVQHALQGHFRNIVRPTLSDGALTVPSNLSELAYLQQQPAQLRGITTRLSSRGSERAATAGDGVVEADTDSVQQYESMALNLSIASSPALARYPLSSSRIAYFRNANPSIFSVATVTSAASANNTLGTDAGRSLELRVNSSSSASYFATMQEPVGTAKVWDRMFWRFLNGHTATGDLAVLVALLKKENPAQTQGAGGGSDVSTGYKGAFRTGRGGASPQSGTVNTTAAAADAASASRKRVAASSHSPEYGVQLLMNALKCKGSYSQLMLPQNAADVGSGGIAGSGIAGVADEVMSSSVAAKVERGVMNDDVEQQQQQHARGVLRSPERQCPAPIGGLSPPGLRMNNSSTVLLNLDDCSKEEEVRLHRDFWTHIPTILATLTEGVMYSGSHETAHLDRDGDAAPCGASSGDGGGGEKVGNTQTKHGNRGCWDTAPSQSATNANGSRGEERLDHAASAGVAAAAHLNRDDENELAKLHPPSAEALQLLPIFSPLLRNYTGAVKQLIRSASEYARSTQVQHARALAVAAAPQQQQPALLSTDTKDVASTGGECPAEGEHSATVPTSVAGAPLGNVRAGPTRTATQHSSVVCMHELKCSHASPSGGDRRPGGGSAAAAAATGSTLDANSSAPADIVEQSLLATGSRTEVRAADVVMYAILTAIYVQCSAAVEMHQHARLNSTNSTTAAPISTNAATVGTTCVKRSLSEGSRTSASGHSVEESCPFPGTSISLSFTADGGLGTTSGNNTCISTDEERVFDKSVANVSCGLRDSSSGGGYSLNATFSPPPKTLFHAHPYPPHHIARRAGGKAVGGTMRFTRSSSLYDPRSVHLSPGHAPHPHQQQPSQLPRSVSPDMHSPTEAALSLLRMAHNTSNGSGDWAGRGSAESACSDGPAVGNPGNRFPLHPNPSDTNLCFREPAMQDILTCANEFSSVSLPSIMKAELRLLQEKLHNTSRAVQRMERQVRGELALLLFRILSIVLDWLMPAVHVSDVRLWVFYRKWCCDLYRVLCSSDALLEEFHTLLDQRGLAVSSTATGAGDLHGQPGESRRGTHGVSPVEAISVRTTDNLGPPQGPPPQAQSPLSGRPPVVRTATADNDDHDNSSKVCVAREGATASTGGAAQPPSLPLHLPQVGDTLATTNASMEDAFSFILPGTSLAVSVLHETPPVQPGVLKLLAQGEADLRGEALADMASLRAAQALLNNEGTVVPLPRPFLITRLVAATLRGISADIAESLLWIVGQTPALDDSADNDPGGGGKRDTSNVLEESQRDRNASSGMSQKTRCVADPGGRGSREHRKHSDDTCCGGHTDYVKEDEKESVLRGRHRQPSQSHRRSGFHHRSTSADARMGGSAPSAAASHYRVDSEDDDGEYAGQWYGVLERCERGQQRSLPLQGPAIAKNSERRSSYPTGSVPTVFPHATSHAPFNEHPSTCASQNPSRPSQSLEGPTLVHHHRFHYPSVHGYADVAKLYLSTLEDAEILLSPHDPVYASLVLSAADLHLHDLRDTATAVALVNAYLVDVSKEHIQGPVWEELLAVATGDGGSGGASPSLKPAADVVGSPSSACSAPAKGFSVTRARQGNTQGPTSTTESSTAARVATGLPAAASVQSAPAPSQQQRPYVPMVIASWNNEQEKEEFLATLQLLRQMQANLAVAPTKSESDTLRNGQGGIV